MRPIPIAQRERGARGVGPSTGRFRPIVTPRPSGCEKSARNRRSCRSSALLMVDGGVGCRGMYVLNLCMQLPMGFGQQSCLQHRTHTQPQAQLALRCMERGIAYCCMHAYMLYTSACLKLGIRASWHHPAHRCTKLQCMKFKCSSLHCIVRSGQGELDACTHAACMCPMAPPTGRSSTTHC
jgi:hypothetical protein